MTPELLEARRFTSIQEAFKAAGIVGDLMVEALQAAHPDRAKALSQAIDRGMGFVVSFVFAEDNSRTIIGIVDDYGTLTELAAVNCVMKDPRTHRKN